MGNNPAGEKAVVVAAQNPRSKKKESHGAKGINGQNDPLLLGIFIYHKVILYINLYF